MVLAAQRTSGQIDAQQETRRFGPTAACCAGELLRASREPWQFPEGLVWDSALLRRHLGYRATTFVLARSLRETYHRSRSYLFGRIRRVGSLERTSQIRHDHIRWTSCRFSVPVASAYMEVVESCACPNNCCSVFSGTPDVIALIDEPMPQSLGGTLPIPGLFDQVLSTRCRDCEERGTTSVAAYSGTL
jgi:hypothetical protein